MFFGKSKGQGTIEYLVILAVIVVVSLIVVGLLVDSTAPAEGVSSGSSKLGGWTNSLAVTETAVSPDGNYLVRLANNTGKPVTIKTVKVDDEEVSFSEDLFQGGQQNFKIRSEADCELGQTITGELVVTYVTENGLEKKEAYPADVAFACDDYAVSLLADQCPEWVVHSGQTTSYGTAPDDADKDGTAKSYTDNGDGTVTDNHTGLVWQKDHKDDCTPLTWEDALSYCENLGDGVDGLTDGSSAGDWRVPSNVELITLTDYSYPSSSYLNSVFTQTDWDLSCDGYWSSTTVPSGTSSAYFLYSTSGLIVDADKTSDFLNGVRCVRSES